MAQIVEITNGVQHQDFIRNNRAGVIFFGKSTCPHCQAMTPYFSELARRYSGRVKFGHVEVSRVEVKDIDGVPVFVVYRNGAPVDRVVGEDKDGLRNLIDSL